MTMEANGQSYYSMDYYDNPSGGQVVAENLKKKVRAFSKRLKERKTKPLQERFTHLRRSRNGDFERTGRDACALYKRDKAARRVALSCISINSTICGSR